MVYIKTDKIVPSGESEERIKELTAYVENLREEIEFRLITLSNKIESIYEILRKTQGGQK